MRSLADNLRNRLRRVRRAPLLAIGAAVAVAAGGLSAWAIVTDSELVIVRQLHAPEHLKTFQNELNDLVRAGRHHEAFELAFERGDEIFGRTFNSLDGIGANVGNGERFTRVPRADLQGDRQWFTHFPPRVSGPNARQCAECHNLPAEDGAGPIAANIHRDRNRTGNLGTMLQRNAPHLFAIGAVQRLAEEMTEELRAKTAAAIRACGDTCNIPVVLTTKGVSFGRIVITRGVPIPTEQCTGTDAVPFVDVVDCELGVSADLTGLEGIERDLIVRPFQWKGSVAFVRDFNRDASNQEMGLQSVEVVGENRDGDFDGVINELRVGDQTALSIYNAGQPRPVTRQELARFGLGPRLTREQNNSIARGDRLFTTIGCATCHIPFLTIDKAIFSEPSQSAFYRDERFPAGQDPLSRALNPALAVTFDLTADQPDNIIEFNGRTIRLGTLEKGRRRGSAIVRLFGDLKRHDMGPRLAEQIDEIGNGASTFLTENLWGVGSTAPYLHDGRATTLAEAILLHGGEAQMSRDTFAELPTAGQRDVIAFLDNLVLLKLEEDEE